MKKILSFILLVAVTLVLIGAQATVTVVNDVDRWGKGSAISFTSTTTASTDSVIITDGSNSSIFTGDSRLITLDLNSGEATLDSIRWTLEWQGKGYATQSSWKIISSVTCDSALHFTKVYDPHTSGFYPYMRILLKQSAAKNAVQTVSGAVTLEKLP